MAALQDQGFLAYALVLSMLSFLVTLILTPAMIRALRNRGLVVEDHHKVGRPFIPRPGGPAIIAGLVLSLLSQYLMMGHVGALAIMLTTLIGGLIGLADDFLTLAGPLKTGLLIFGALPVLLLQAYDYHLALPLGGTLRLSIIYPILVLIAVPVVANTVNTIDVLNGVVSTFMITSTLPIFLALILKGSYQVALSALPLLATSIAFHIFHRYPSKIFPGDSGTMAMGSYYAALVMVGGVEFVGVVSILPAILNSFLFLSSTKRIAEHRQLKLRPVQVSRDGILIPSRESKAPVTLVRMILAQGPMTERDVVRAITILSLFTSFLGIMTAFIMWGITW